MSKPVLGYWNIRGFAQHIRLLLAHLGVDYEDIQYEQEEDVGEHNFKTWFEKEKFNMGLDFPNLPYWVEGNGLKLTQSRAIIKHIARDNDASLMGDTNEEKRHLDMLEGVAWDIIECLVRCVYDYNDARKSAWEERMPQYLELLEKFLGEKKWFLGDTLKYVDFTLYEAIEQQKHYKTDVLKSFPKLERFLSDFEALPGIEKYRKEPNFINSPVYSKWAIHKI